jgi:hypothetical protein
VDINRAWKTIRENIKTLAEESQVIMNWRSTGRGLTKDAQNY